MHGLTVGEVAKRAAVHIATLRYYERQGLVARPPRSTSNYRLYPEETVRRVQFIKRAQQLGFSLKEIQELLALRTEPQTQCADVRERAVAKIHEIEHKVRTLQAMHVALTKLVAACVGQGSITNCPILESLDKDQTMATKRTIEIFSAGCPACEETVTLVKQIACPSCAVTILDMRHPDVARRAKSLGVRSVPAVVIDGKLADCCTGRGPDEATLRVAGLGQPL